MNERKITERRRPARAETATSPSELKRAGLTMLYMGCYVQYSFGAYGWKEVVTGFKPRAELPFSLGLGLKGAAKLSLLAIFSVTLKKNYFLCQIATKKEPVWKFDTNP